MSPARSSRNSSPDGIELFEKPRGAGFQPAAVWQAGSLPHLPWAGPRPGSGAAAMPFSTILRGERFPFADLREVLAKANEEKSGDALAGLAARSERERVAAKTVLADVRLGEIVDAPLLDPDRDEVSRLLLDHLDQGVFRSIRSLTVGEFRE